MGLVEKTGMLLTYYHDNVRPALDSGRRHEAFRSFSNLYISGLLPEFYELFTFHSGPQGYVVAKEFFDCLRSGLPSSDVREEFEAYLAQLHLSVKSGNSG